MSRIISTGEQSRYLRTCTLGAMNELVVCADLFAQGYEVYRALNPSAPVDLIALTRTKILRIEVRTGTINLRGEIKWPKKPRDLVDHYAVVLPNREVHYDPPLPPVPNGGSPKLRPLSDYPELAEFYDEEGNEIIQEKN